ncbi:MAG: prephenate dehydratase, partial [Christensenellaceae bacterium]|nr:prephenate dehydratase [Christensenellaceae bacterium]
QKGLCTYGVLPLENSTAGSVNAVYDLMKKYNFRIVKSLRLPVKHCLLVNKGAKLSDIKEITSHEQALSQCAEYLKKFKDCKITPDENTAVAAQRLVLSGRTDLAVIASEKSGEIYGLSALESGINDNPGNYTRFILIAKDLRLYDKADKISVMMTLPHETGSLNKVLAKFTSVGLNLTKLESRPMPQTAFEFLFYFDFEGDVSSNEVLNLIAELDNSTGLFVFLGAYAEK